MKKINDQKKYILDLQMQVFFLEKYLQSKQTEATDFKKFYKTKLMAENTYLKSIVTRLSPFEDIMIQEVANLKTEKAELLEQIKRAQMDKNRYQVEITSLEGEVIESKRYVNTQRDQVKVAVLTQLMKLQKKGTDGQPQSLDQDVLAYLLGTLLSSASEMQKTIEDKNTLELELKKL